MKNQALLGVPFLETRDFRALLALPCGPYIILHAARGTSTLQWILIATLNSMILLKRMFT